MLEGVCDADVVVLGEISGKYKRTNENRQMNWNHLSCK